MSDQQFKLIGGAGDEGGGGGGGNEIADTVRATQSIQLIDVLSEGPIKGLVPNSNGDVRSSIFFDDTPLLSEMGGENYRVASLEWRNGEPNQLPFSGFTEIKQIISVGVQVKYDGSGAVTRTLNNPNANRVLVTVSTPAMYHQNKESGDIGESHVDYEILIQTNNGGFVSQGVFRMREKVSSQYVREHIFPLSGTGPWDIRVRRLSPDSEVSNTQNTLVFDSITALIDSRLTYSNTAVVALGGNASDFSRVPTRAYLVDGLIISVPSNYDPINGTYTGTWDGTFKQAWSNNPAWVLYDLQTNDRYGLGKYIPKELIDKWTLYTIAQYCDEPVPNGFGGFEPRYTCNAYIFNEEDAYTLLQNIASIFSGIVYWGAGAVQAVQDRPREVEAIFTNANVINGEFTYKGTSLRSRHTVAVVTWNDPLDLYKARVEYVEDEEAIAKWGVIPTQVVAYGCTSRGQAHRYGRRILYTEQNETEIVSFKTGIEGFYLYPGAVIQTADAARSGIRLGGRVLEATTDTIKLDSEVKLVSGKQYKISLVSPTGDVHTCSVVNAGADTDTIKVTPALPSAPLPESTWIIHTEDFNHKTWRVTGIEIVDKVMVEVTAMAYRGDKYDAIDKGLKLEPLRYTNSKAQPDQPKNLTLLVANKSLDGAVVSLHGTLSWTGNASYYSVRYRYENEGWQNAQVTEDPPTLELPNLQVGRYFFTVTPFSALGVAGVPATLEYEVTPQSIKLPAVTGLALEGRWDGNTAKFKWDAVKGATGYTVRVSLNGEDKRVVAVGDSLRFDYGAEDMRADGGPWRGFDFSVKATGKWGSESDWATITVGNRQASAPVSMEVTAGFGVAYVNIKTPPEDDIVGMVVWCSADPDCPAIDENKVYDGAVGMVTIAKLADGSALEIGKTYYVRAAVYDNFGRDALNASTAIPIIPLTVDIGPDTITETEIKDDSISTPKLRANAVRAHNIAANEVYGRHVVAQQITGEHVQIGSLNANHFTSGMGSSNLLPNAGLIPTWSNSDGQQADGWSVVGGGVGAGGALSLDASRKPPNTEYMALVFSTGTAVRALSVVSERFPVAPNTWYELHMLSATRTGGTLGQDGVLTGVGNLKIELQFFNSLGFVVQPKATSGTLTSGYGGKISRALGDWKQIFGLMQAPDAAMSAQFVVTATVSSSTSHNEFAFTRPYAGVAVSPLQITPTPWAPPGLGTQISGGMIKTHTIHAKAIAVDKLSAFTANLGEVTAGDIYGPVVRGGGFTSWAWPTGVQGGYYLSSNGLRMGNESQGRFFEVTSGGNIRMPGMSVIGGTLTIDHLNVIKSSNIQRGSVSKVYKSSGVGAEITVVVDKVYPHGSVQDNTATLFVSLTGSVTVDNPTAVLELYTGGRWQPVASATSTVFIEDQGGSGASRYVRRVTNPSPMFERRTQASAGSYRMRVTCGGVPTAASMEILILYK